MCDLRCDPSLSQEDLPVLTVELLRVFVHSEIETLNLVFSDVNNRMLFECLSLERLKDEVGVEQTAECEEWEDLADESSFSGLIPYHAGSIRTLDLSYCHSLEGGVKLVAQFVESFPKLTRLSIAGCFSSVAGPETFSAIAHSMPTLKYLDLSGCFWLNDSLLRSHLLAISPSALEVYEWGDAAAEDLEGGTPTELPLPNLERLTLRMCSVSSRTVSYIMSCRPQLTIITS
eukprot:JP446594.1.p1 GENE.JP446594.1~~JP446594.1.p1  ORF type:complete len:231 (+),score=40.40 JP446594.1:207-899(+)